MPLGAGDSMIVGKIKRHMQTYSLSQKIYSESTKREEVTQLMLTSFSYKLFNAAVGKLRRIEVCTPDITVVNPDEDSQRFEFQQHTGPQMARTDGEDKLKFLEFDQRDPVLHETLGMWMFDFRGRVTQ